MVKVATSVDAAPATPSNFWRQMADNMCTAGKLKQTNLGVEDKAAFLDFYFRPKTKDTGVKSTPKPKRRA